mmetsp:Transcript_11953/g.26214  ORF Transcript_11953/g.26214 Transcript_11953/m.26214 type:complete len:136 (-) Transcript_11953:56-463(-)
MYFKELPCFQEKRRDSGGVRYHHNNLKQAINLESPSPSSSPEKHRHKKVNIETPTPSPPTKKQRRSMRTRTIYKLSSNFAMASPTTKGVTTDVLDELGRDDSLPFRIIDSFEGSAGCSQDAANVVVAIYKSRAGN